ncbi:DNA starvation/stationary phase protection protein Dps [Rubellimicrobium roseum]|uniref:DNA starvation/stationary phase protection protein Dps n=1 Tax=Rubellimicrobium roseum TaxID=687525 RepID=A0A5C4NAU9_9RHOB|nr:DNA starvation/stationary phase protection protein Dps [Rubellimicrobium roseum]TNC71813.1 DNA starvation/stationary phase protection protein Dps [Rubellimicrobium roseum]
MPESFAGGLDAQTRTRMADLLNANLADAIALTLSVKEAHWNLKGPGFIGVHELLDKVADRLRESADLMAERAVILGGLARGTVEAAARASRVEPYPTDIVAIEQHLEALRDRFVAVGANLREAIDEAGEAGDEDTADILTEVSRQVDKDAWFIGANLRPSEVGR